MAKVCRSVETHRLRDTGSPRALAKVQAKVQAKVKAKARNEHPKHVCVVARKDTRKETVNSRLRRVKIAERLVT